MSTYTPKDQDNDPVGPVALITVAMDMLPDTDSHKSPQPTAKEPYSSTDDEKKVQQVYSSRLAESTARPSGAGTAATEAPAMPPVPPIPG